MHRFKTFKHISNVDTNQFWRSPLLIEIFQDTNNSLWWITSRPVWSVAVLVWLTSFAETNETITKCKLLHSQCFNQFQPSVLCSSFIHTFGHIINLRQRHLYLYFHCTNLVSGKTQNWFGVWNTHYVWHAGFQTLSCASKFFMSQL